MKRFAILVVLAALAALVAAMPAAADDTACVGVLPPGAYDNVVVPSGASCFIAGSAIKGNLKLEPGSGVTDVRNSSIGGNVQGDTAGSLDLHGSFVGGSVQVKKLATNVQVCNSTVRGDLQVEEQQSGRIEIGNTPTCTTNTIQGSLQIYKNTVTVQSRLEVNVVGGNLQVFENVGPINIFGNQIEGNLQCFKNVPPPTGGANVAAQKQGQCEFL